MIHSFYHHGDEVPAAELSLAQIRAARGDPAGMLWIDLEAPTAQELQATLSDTFRFHPLTVAACLAATPQPELGDYGSYLFLTPHLAAADAPTPPAATPALPAAVTVAGGSPPIPRPLPPKKGKGGMEEAEATIIAAPRSPVLGLFLGSNYVVTVHQGALPTVTALRTVVASDVEQLAAGADRFAAGLLEQAAEEHRLRIWSLSDALTALTAEMCAHAGPVTVRRLVALRWDLAEARLAMQRESDVLRTLAEAALAPVRAENRLYYRAVHHGLRTTIGQAEALYQQSEALSGAQLVVVVSEMNRTMRWLALALTALAAVTALAFVYLFVTQLGP